MLDRQLPPRYQTFVDFRGARWKYRNVKEGGALSLLLFNMYLRNIPDPLSEIELIFYEDDYTMLTSGNNIE